MTHKPQTQAQREADIKLHLDAVGTKWEREFQYDTDDRLAYIWLIHRDKDGKETRRLPSDQRVVDAINARIDEAKKAGKLPPRWNVKTNPKKLEPKKKAEKPKTDEPKPDDKTTN